MKSLRKFCVRAVENGRKVLLVGAPGTGKTSLWNWVAEQVDRVEKIIISTPAIKAPEDYRGFPHLFIRDGKPGAEFVPYSDLELVLNWTGGESGMGLLLFVLDDAGQASPMVQKSVMPLIQGGTLDGKKMVRPDLVRFVACTNHIGTNDGVEEFIEPLKTRFDNIIEYVPEAEDWIANFADAKLHPIIPAFIARRPDLLCPDRGDFDPDLIVNSANPRTWESASKTWEDVADFSSEEKRIAMASSIGEAVAIQFMAFQKLLGNCPDAAEIAADPMGAALVSQLDHVYLVISQLLVETQTAEQADAFCRYLGRIGGDAQWLYIRKAIKGKAKDALYSSEFFVDWASDEQNHQMLQEYFAS